MEPRRNEEHEETLVVGGRYSNPRNAKPETRNSPSLRDLRDLRGENLFLKTIGEHAR